MPDLATPSRRGARICIVGGGASGLTVARRLRRRGYRHITVLEREPRLGGKCCTIEHEGRAYELGAAALSFQYGDVAALLLETRTRAVPVANGAFVDLERGRRCRLPLPSLGWQGLGRETLRMARELWRHRRIRRPGFADVSPELSAPFASWSVEHGVERMGELIKPLVTGFGYGFYGEVPAAYVLKYARLISLPLFEIPEGYGVLWERVARSLADLRIRTQINIERIERTEDHVRVHTDGGSFDFDALVLACPLDQVAPCLDLSAAESELFARIRDYDYFVVAAAVEGIPHLQSLFFPRNFAPERIGAPMFVYQRWPGRGLSCFYGFARERGDEAGARAAVHATVAQLGGRVRQVVATKCWRYFPHVGPADMAGGFYARLEALQGQRATYYCGELLALATVETTVEYARALVERHFPPVAA
jgi:hypothetical protein